jgi:hypothetical protein
VRGKIFATIAIIWGGAILISAFTRGGPDGSGAYAVGQTGGIVFGALLLVGGAYYFLKKSK